MPWLLIRAAEQPEHFVERLGEHLPLARVRHVAQRLVPREDPRLDDLVVVVLAVDLFLDGVPAELLDEKLRELDIDRVAFDRDVAQIRRLTPGPLRRTIRRVPDLVAGVGSAVNKFDPGPRLRGWIAREDPIT